jgi:hypothetical protein
VSNALQPRPSGSRRKESWLSGYLETRRWTIRCNRSLALLAQIYAQATARARTGKRARWSRRIRYLTTDRACGIALPMSSFMPPRAGKPTEPQHGTFFEAAVAQLNKATQDRLKKAKRIGLTVAFDLEVIAGRLRPMFSPDPKSAGATPDSDGPTVTCSSRCSASAPGRAASACRGSA